MADYLRDIAEAKQGSGTTAAKLIELDGRLNELWGQIDYVLFVLDAGNIKRTI